jgi:hypothetical protein
MRFRYLVLLGAFVLPCSNASAQNTLAAMISNQYRVAPVVPFAAFDRESAAAPLPGSTIGELSQHTLDGISTTDLSAATVCKSQSFNYGPFTGTQGFRQLFPAGSPANRTELRLLFGFDDDALAAIQSYDVTVSSAGFLTVPYDRLPDIKAQTRARGRCSGPDSSRYRTVIKPVVANVGVAFRLARPFSEETLRFLRQKFPGHPHEAQNLEYRLSMHSRLIALGLED